MLRLNLPDKPYWMDDLPSGARLFVRPCDAAIMGAAKARGIRRMTELVAAIADVRDSGGDVSGLPDLADPDARNGLSQMMFAQSLAEVAIVEWEGIGDETGAPIPFSPAAARALMRYPKFADTWLDKYTAPIDAASAEGNGSGPSRNSTSVEGRNTGTAA